MATIPYGEWPSPISALDLTKGSHPVGGGRFVGDEVWWTELRPNEGGRYAIVRAGADVLPAPWNARTRVHEYGGSCWTVTDEGAVVFSNFADQRLWLLAPGGGEPTPLTPEPEVPAGLRYAEPFVKGDEVWCIRETHAADGTLTRDIAAVPLDGSMAVRSVVAGSHFYAYPRLSPDGASLAWIAWEHPQMPWDGTELRVADVLSDGTCGPHEVLLGSTTESVLQPEWIDDESLYVISDRSGWWNLHRATVETAEVTPLHSAAADFGGPLWSLGTTFYKKLDDGRLLTVSTLGVDTLGLLDPATGAHTPLETPGLQTIGLGGAGHGKVLLSTGGARVVSGLRSYDLATGDVAEVRLNLDETPDFAYFPEAQPHTFTAQGGREVHAIVYPPHNPDATAPEGALPPYVAFVHGGPTGHSPVAADPVKAYFTSRGIGVVDVNYGGSTGYGREYRERLRGQWGIVDVQDTVAAVQGLAAEGLADPARLAIEGGSAGGWTVLAALTSTDVFACGASYFGVAELIEFSKETHDFESRYTDGLVAPRDQLDVLNERAPLTHVDGLSCPVLLLQGLDDPIVLPSQAELFRDALLAKGIPHAYLAYEGESHGFRRAETIINARESELSFYGQVMGFAPPAVPVLELWRP